MSQNQPSEKPSFLRRAGGLATTAMTLALSAGLVVAASTFIADRAETAVVVEEMPAVTVRTTALALQDGYAVETSYRGRVEAGQRVGIGFEAGGTLTEILVDEGDLVRQGDIIARVDTRALEAQRAAEVAGRDALLAQAELARRTAERQRALAERNHASAQRLDEAELALSRLTAEVRRADAAIAALDIALEKAVITAPFDARVGVRMADIGAQLAPGAAVAELYENVAPTLRVGVPAAVAEKLEPGLDAEIEIGDRVYTGVLRRLRGDIDPVTRTRDLVFSLDEAEALPDGALGSLRLDRWVDGEGAWVPVAALGEGVRGLWTVFVVGDDGVARREAVELIHTAGGNAFVRGHLDEGAAIVVSGPHRIADGQPVLAAGS